MLADAHGGKKAARLLAGVIAAIVQLGEEPVQKAVCRAVEAGHCDLLQLNQRLYPRQVCRVAVPEKLRAYRIESAAVGDYDWMLQGGGQ